MGCNNSKELKKTCNDSDNESDNDSDIDENCECQIYELPNKLSFAYFPKDKIEETYLDDISYDGEDEVM